MTETIQPEITLKEVFERIIKLEARMEMKELEDKKTTKMFTKYVFLLTGIELVDIIIGVILYFRV